MTDTTWTTETVTAQVEQANDEGVKLAGRPKWANLPKTNPLSNGRPDVGATITAVLITNAAGRTFIKSWEHAGGDIMDSAPNTTPHQPPAAAPPPAAPHGRQVEPRDRLMARMSALKSATALVEVFSGNVEPGSTWEPTEDLVLGIAAIYSKWLLEE